MPWDTDALNAPHTCRELMQDDQPMTQAEFTDRFVAQCLKQCGFTHFDDGGSVADYAREIAQTYWSDPDYREDGPEACADSNMECWGEG